MYGLSGTTNLRVMATAFVGQERDPLLVLAVILVVAGVGFKIAAVPFHMWAPDVYEGAPTPVTAFLSVGSKAASFAMLLRIFLEGLPSMSADWRLLFEVLAIVTMTVGNIAALTQSNLKRMLAYSSIAHAGYLLIGVVAGTPRGVSAMLIYLLIYSFMQLGAFAVIVMMRRQDVVGDELKDFSGLYFRHPLAAFAMLLFMLSLGRYSADRRIHGEVLAVRRGDRCRLRVAGGDRRAEQRGLALLLRPDRGVHVSEADDGRLGAGDHEPGAGLDARGRGGRPSCVLGVYPRLLFELAESSARTLGGRGVTAATALIRPGVADSLDAGLAGLIARALPARGRCVPRRRPADGRARMRQVSGRRWCPPDCVKFFTRYAILVQPVG